MFKNKKTLILSLVIIILAGIILYTVFFRAKFLRKPSTEKIFESFQSVMKPVKIDEMNIIIFTIDTLRADHLECYGYENIQTPNINRLAREGILFEYNIAQAPLTLPSHASILTGTYPLFHGVRDNGGFYLEQNHITIAETLKGLGFTTGAFVAAFVLDSRWGLDQGFDYYFDNFDLSKYKTISLDSVQRRGDEVLAEAYKWLEKNQQEKFFAWIHLYDPHTPYDPPEPYKDQYSDRQYRLYDGEIAYVDQLMGEFREFMEEKDLLDKTVIVFTSDHGESLGEHKESAHGFFIYDAAVRVPLIIRFPENKLGSKVIESQVKSIDIMPTVLNLLGEPIPESIQGESFLPLILGKEEKERPSAYSETYWPRYHYGWSELKSLRKGRFKFIDAPRPELYDVLEDPGEIDNIVNREATLGHEMKRELESLIERYSAEGIEDAGPKKIDNDSLVKLQALGYIGSFHASSKEEGGKLADPKDKIELYNEIKLAQFLVTEEKMEEAERKIKDVLNKDESVLEARYILGNIYLKQKKYDEAIEEYKKSLAVDPDYYDAIFGLARAYKRAENYDEAIVGFERMISIDSRDTKSYWHLADIYLEKKEYDKALEYMKTCVEIDPEAPVFHNKLGAVYIKKEMYDLAEKEVKTALSFKRSVPLTNAHFNLGLIHEARGGYDLAIMEYRKEQEISPHNFKPDFNLGLLYSKAKEIDKAIEEFQSCIEKNEEFAGAYCFLAKAYMDSGKDLKKAEELALKGLSLKPYKRTTILTHFVLADIYNRLKRYDKYEHHVAKANELKKSLDE